MADIGGRLSSAASGIAAALLILVSAARADSERLVIVSPHWEGIRHEIGRAFVEEMEAEGRTGIEVSWFDIGGASEIIRYLGSELKSRPEGVGIDVVFGGGVDIYDKLKKMNALAVLPLDQYAGWKEIHGQRLVDPDGFWAAPILSAFGILCNKKVLERLDLPVPSQWSDLADPRYRTWVGLADPRKSGSLHMTFEVILQSEGWNRGWEVLRGITKNVRGFSPDSNKLTHDVASGEIACSPAIDSQAAIHMREAGPRNITFVIPYKQSVIGGDAAAILATAPHRDLALRFMKFLFSRRGQRTFWCPLGAPEGPVLAQLSRLPVVPEYYERADPSCPPPIIRPMDGEATILFDSAKSTTRWEVLNELIGISLIEPKNMGDESLRHGEPAFMVTEEEALARVPSWKDPVTRARDVRAWKDAMRGEEGWNALVLRCLPSAGILLLAVVGFIRRAGRRAARGSPIRTRA